MRFAALSRVVMLGLGAVAAWSWLQHGMPLLDWTIPLCAVAAALWPYLCIAGPGHRRDDSGVDSSDDVVEVEPEFVDLEITPMESLLKRDLRFLQDMYDLTNGRPGIFIEYGALLHEVALTATQLEVAADRLAKIGRIQANGWHYALKRRGAEDVERAHRSRKRASMTTSYHFHASASGVFGSHNKVSQNTFRAAGPPAELIDAVLAAVDGIRPYLDLLQEDEIEQAAEELKDAGQDSAHQRRAVSRLVQIAKTLGEVGAPLLSATAALLKVLT
jgi:hypothetical protein